MSTIWRSFGSASNAALAELQTIIGCELPSDYREFLRVTNGGQIRPNLRQVPEISGQAGIDVLFGVGLCRDFDALAWTTFLLDELSSGIAVIGADPFGNLFLLNAQENGEVYYWDHIRSLRSSTDNRNAYLVALTFSAFMRDERKLAGNNEEISGPLGAKLLESVWHDTGTGTLQEVNRWVCVEFSRAEGLAFG